jgi:acylphosphatase
MNEPAGFRLHISVSGDVQGVFFRAGAQEEASRIGGITGWVRNTPEGGVEIVAEGERPALQSLLEWCSHGPAGAVVEKIEHEWLDYTGEFGDFKIKYG